MITEFQKMSNFTYFLFSNIIRTLNKELLPPHHIKEMEFAIRLIAYFHK